MVYGVETGPMAILSGVLMAVGGLGVAIIISCLWDKYQFKKAPSRQAKGAQISTYNYYTTKGDLKWKISK